MILVWGGGQRRGRSTKNKDSTAEMPKQTWVISTKINKYIFTYYLPSLFHKNIFAFQRSILFKDLLICLLIPPFRKCLMLFLWSISFRKVFLLPFSLSHLSLWGHLLTMPSMTGSFLTNANDSQALFSSLGCYECIPEEACWVLERLCNSETWPNSLTSEVIWRSDVNKLNS